MDTTSKFVYNYRTGAIINLVVIWAWDGTLSLTSSPLILTLLTLPVLESTYRVSYVAGVVCDCYSVFNPDLSLLTNTSTVPVTNPRTTLCRSTLVAD